MASMITSVALDLLSLVIGILIVSVIFGLNDVTLTVRHEARR